MRNIKEIRKLAERNDPKDYVKEPDSDDEVKDIEPRVKSQKKFVDMHKKASDDKTADHPVDTKDQYKSSLKTTSPDGNNAGGEKTPPKQGDSKDYTNVRKKMKESTEVEEIDEEVEEITEMVSAGNIKLNDGSTVSLSSSDAKKVNEVIAGLNPENRKKMESEMKKDKKSFNKMLSFVRSAD
jgi:hypothetical protein